MGSVMGKGRKWRGATRVGSHPMSEILKNTLDCRTDLVGGSGRGGCTCTLALSPERQSARILEIKKW